MVELVGGVLFTGMRHSAEFNGHLTILRHIPTSLTIHYNFHLHLHAHLANLNEPGAMRSRPSPSPVAPLNHTVHQHGAAAEPTPGLEPDLGAAAFRAEVTATEAEIGGSQWPPSYKRTK